MSKIAILTNFMEMVPGYSLTGIVEDQCLMLQRYGHDVNIFVNSQYNPHYDEAWGKRLRLNEDNPVKIRKEIPFSHLIDYQTKEDITEDHQKIAHQTAELVVEKLAEMDYVFTHDFIFTGWNLPYAIGIRLGSAKLGINPKWLHWVHSVPSGFKDWWSIRSYGPNHKIIFPNKTDRRRVAEQFRGWDSDIRIIPHIKDMRSFFDFGEDACEFIDDYPNIMQADVVMVYPASTDRLTAKGVKKVIMIFKHIKTMGLSVCLVIANQWATGKQRKEDVSEYMKTANAHDLIVKKEFIFTSEWKKPEVGGEGVYAVGIPRKMLRELAMLSNLFVFPTTEESFGLVLPEMCMAGSPMPVLNKSLQMQMEVSGNNGLFFDFGSHEHDFKPENWNAYLGEVAKVIVKRMKEDEGLQAKTWMRQRYNWDVVYHRDYAPTLAESEMWE